MNEEKALIIESLCAISYMLGQLQAIGRLTGKNLNSDYVINVYNSLLGYLAVDCKSTLQDDSEQR